MRRVARPRSGGPLAATTATLAAGRFLAPAAPGPGTGTVPHSLTGPDGAGPPSGAITGSHGVILGTTVLGGRRGNGAAFSLTACGTSPPGHRTAPN